MRNALLLSVCAFLIASCQASSNAASPATRHNGPPMSAEFDLPVARAPYDALTANWKQRLDQAYVFVEVHGDYREIGRAIERAFAAADAASIEIVGPPFALYFDDPGKVAIDKLRARACLPVAKPIEAREPLGCDVLDSTTVVYAFVGGPYPEVPRAYPGLFKYMGQLDWIESGPIREIYWQDPGNVKSWDDLVTEVQIPAARRP